ncbi:hypothetical protein NCAS_0E02760 [Naumovozyma castellii]|uniref:Protein transport protein Sec61 subunit beta n=1 Tax=Naumovozyma castellii TaxID=27288 RepID=G0VFS9_NAUCA|nr:hypothetical protein NCAS_0E02760 [Naumovozyma castellii CBS 4309]CCC70346.1 hypothetical protein NCAS_0E02760 [Naumovozyma castellii CBS 4309]
MSSVAEGPRSLQKRKPAAKKAESAQEKPATVNSNNPIFKIYSDEANGLKVDPLVVLFLAVGFIFSVVALHVISKLTSKVF